jgi:hypothetical protein
MPIARRARWKYVAKQVEFYPKMINAKNDRIPKDAALYRLIWILPSSLHMPQNA